MTTPLLTQDAQFWQTIEPAGTYEHRSGSGFRDGYPAKLNDGRELLLPIRPRDQGRSALASLIINQASFTVVDALASEVAAQLAARQIQLLVGVPTLGLTLAEATARKLGHTRYLPLGTSKKFWYDESLSVPMSSITSPGQQKRLYIDPRLRPLLVNQRIALVDDVLSTGSSMAAALALMDLCGAQPVCIGCAMLQTLQWQEKLASALPGIEDNVVASIHSPRLVPSTTGGWIVANT